MNVDCETEKKDLDDAKLKHDESKKKYNECISKTFHEKAKQKEYKLKDLLKTIKSEKSNNVLDLLNQFPHPGSGMADITNTDSHVFEALWIIVFLLEYDNFLLPGEKRQFYIKLETNEADKRDISDIIETTHVNASNSGGIADIFFKHITDGTKCDKCGEKIQQKVHHVCKDTYYTCSFKGGEEVSCGLPACSSDKCNVVDTVKNKNTNYLFSAKYFNKEKGVSKYDIADIYIEASPRLKEYNIMLLVKDKKMLLKKMNTSNKELTNRFHEILDASDLDTYYKLLKYELEDKNNVDEFLELKNNINKSTKPPLIPRFHQQYFIDYTIEQIKAKNLNICWGAVPRSGKSYMVAGLIAKRQPKQVVIFLGAVTETVGQFEEMFKKHSDFNDYNIVNVQNAKYDGIQPNKKNIVLISQQKGWIIGKGDENLMEILKKTNKLIFFDEIHQGASIGIAQNKLLEYYVFNKPSLESPFIMVTATFAKPLLNYINRGDTRTKLIQWSYDNIQQMKTIHEPYNFQTFIDTIKSTDINENDGETKATILTNLVDDLEKRGVTLEHLASQYDKYPELIVLCPGLEDTVENPQHGIPEVSELNKNSICNVIFKSTKNKFTHQDSAVDKFIQYIVKTIYDKLLKRRFKYDVFETPHSQLWFLPTPAGCRSEKKNSDINNKKNEIKKKKETNADTKKLDEELKELEVQNNLDNQ